MASMPGSDSIPRGEKIARMMVWAPLVAGALAVVVSKRTVLWQWAHDIIGDTPGLSARRAEQFARTIIGKPRHTISKLLGPPAATVGNDQWYYPVSGRERVALTIRFAADHVQSASVLRGTEQTAGVKFRARV